MEDIVTSRLKQLVERDLEDLTYYEHELSVPTGEHEAGLTKLALLREEAAEKIKKDLREVSAILREAGF